MKINRKQKIILAIGSGFLAALWGATFILRQTTWLDKPALTCRTFLTKDQSYPAKKVNICLTEIVEPFSSLSEDALYQISFINPTIERRIDITMRVSVPATPRKLTILWRVTRVQLYNPGGVLVKSSEDRYTSSYPRYLPKDTIEPLWWWLVQMSRLHTEPQPDLETTIDGVVERFSRTVATVTAGGLTVWRFLSAASE